MRVLVPWTWLIVVVAVAPASTAAFLHVRSQEPDGPTAHPGAGGGGSAGGAGATGSGGVSDGPAGHTAPVRPAPDRGDSMVAGPAQIRQALSAGPAAVARFATVRAPNTAGRLVSLRHGTNGFTCFPDNPASPGLDPMCADSQAIRWMESLMRHEMRPANTAPGLVYMLQGGSDLDAAGPWSPGSLGTGEQEAGAREADAREAGARWIDSPPHYMILWPFDPARTGFSATPKRTGSWIMWPGTPYAHLMVNQVP